MKLAVFTILVLVGLAYANPVADPSPKIAEVEKSAENAPIEAENDLKADATYWGGYGGYYRPYYSSWGGYYRRPWHYSNYGGWGGGYGGGYYGWPKYSYWG